MSFLYEIFNNPFAKKEMDRIALPASISDNLRDDYGQRPYQVEAFKRFVYLYNEDFDGKPDQPFHLLYNMATGSGKTLIMAGLLLYLYEKGYRNFLFFVNSTNIIKKTKVNFLSPNSSKYLFNQKIVIDAKEVYVKEVDNFDSADDQNINVKFTTIQQLHIDLNTTKENSVTYEDFDNKKIVLIADEAHHLNSATKNDDGLFGNWESTVLEILKQNISNILLEFTATLDFGSAEITRKYQHKVIYKYDLARFRADKYSKEINLVRSMYNEHDRILQALILNLYRQELAAAHNINLKPVILFKAKKTIKESEQNKINFHLLIDGLSANEIEKIQKTSTIDIVQQAFAFFHQKNISLTEIVRRICFNFKEENCISANNDDEAELNQIKLNTLEDSNNPIRAIFAVQKLNEGWDVLNLFDIVRLYEGQNTGGSNTKIGSTTLSEAQLIGRGARYFPFKIEEEQDKFTRKYDNDISNDLKILEELYYHTKEESRYISELKKALIDSGIYEDQDKLVTKKLILKPTFKTTDLYKSGKVLFNKKIPKAYENVKSFSDLGVSKKNQPYSLSSGRGKISNVFNPADEPVEKLVEVDMPLSKIPKHIIQYALSQNPFFYFENIKDRLKCFPQLGSLSDFIASPEYLGAMGITFKGNKERLNDISNQDLLLAVQELLQAIEIDIKANLVEYEGSAFVKDYIHNVFTDKEIKVYRDSEREDGQEQIVNEDWYAYNANYGTSEEKAFVKLFARIYKDISERFRDIFLIRNERELKIIDEAGRAFEPDFLLFCKEKNDRELMYQVFIEPKGEVFIENDKWKEKFLAGIKNREEIINVDSEKYRITGVPFYNNKNENEFVDSLKDTLGIQE